MLIDDVKISVKAGDGGDGAATLRRDGQTAKGGPDGGNGGNGGNIYVVGINDVTGLQQFQYKKTISAENGIKGGRQNMYGRNGVDTIISLPIGTFIEDLNTKETWEITDTTTKILIAKGGHGGRGNNEFKTATNQTPQYAEKGEPGQERSLHFILRLIADIGFIGLPNAGKSSLLKALTNAKPKIGNYPFTTLEPNLGVMDHYIIADIPGLIEGASLGKGLGIKFLKHVEKTTILFHFIDSTEKDVLKTYTTVRNELEKFNASLLQKKEIILLTKTDLISEAELNEKINQLSLFKKEILTVSIYDNVKINKFRIFLQKINI